MAATISTMEAPILKGLPFVPVIYARPDSISIGDNKKIFIAVATDDQWKKFCTGFDLNNLLSVVNESTNGNSPPTPIPPMNTNQHQEGRHYLLRILLKLPVVQYEESS